MKNPERQVRDEDIRLVKKQRERYSRRGRENIGEVGIIHLEATRASSSFHPVLSVHLSSLIHSAVPSLL